MLTDGRGYAIVARMKSQDRLYPPTTRAASMAWNAATEHGAKLPDPSVLFPSSVTPVCATDPTRDFAFLSTRKCGECDTVRIGRGQCPHCGGPV